MKLLPISPHTFAFVDDDDYEDLIRFSWHISGKGYVQRSYRIDGRRYCEWLHRRVMNTPDNREVHHINGDKLDCQKLNLTNLTSLEHAAFSTYSPGNKTGYRGVTFHGKTGTYHATMKVGGYPISLGYYATAQEAGEAYQNAKGVEANKP